MSCHNQNNPHICHFLLVSEHWLLPVFPLTWWAKGPIRTKHTPEPKRPLNSHRTGPVSLIQAAVHSINKADQTPLTANQRGRKTAGWTADPDCWEKSQFITKSNEIGSYYQAISHSIVSSGLRRRLPLDSPGTSSYPEIEERHRNLCYLSLKIKA